jgi:CRP/FNR family transcriptional regulator/CRP/FNR family cyclic AMP-dependent transcriptional regulator
MVKAAPLEPTLALFREIKLLNVFDDSELEQLITLGEIVTFEPHTNVVIEGEMSWGLYLILGGFVGINKTNKLTGDVYDVGQLKAGSFFGEMSLIDHNPRSATVKALTEVQLYHVGKDAFHQFLNQSSELKLRFYESCVKSLVSRLREVDENYVISQYQLWKLAFKDSDSDSDSDSEAA